MNLGIALYRLVTVAWLALLVSAIYIAVIGKAQSVVMYLLPAVVLIVCQALAFRCKNCRTRPGLWLFAVWTILLDYEFYLLDILFLRKCPKCELPFKTRQDQSSVPS